MTDNQKKPSSKTTTAETDEVGSTTTERVHIGTIWAIQYWRELFNFRFDRYLIIQVIPGVYGLALAGIICGLLFISVEAFMQSIWRGLFYLFVGAPFLFLLLASFLRATLELYIVLFRMAKDLDDLAGISETVDRLGGMSEAVADMVSITRGFPLLRLFSRRDKE